MICCRNALREPSSLDFHHFFVFSEKDEGVPVGRGGSCEMSLGVCGTPSRIWGDVHLPNTRPGKLFLHVEHPRPPPSRGTAEVLVFDGKCGNGHGNVGQPAVADRIRVSVRKGARPARDSSR
jgi:hypothetical protein